MHEAGEGNDPEVHDIDHITARELEGSVLGTWAGEHRTKRTNQKAIG